MVVLLDLIPFLCVLFAFLQPDLAEGEEVINQDIMELKEGLYQQVVSQYFYFRKLLTLKLETFLYIFFLCLFPSLKLFCFLSQLT